MNYRIVTNQFGLLIVLLSTIMLIVATLFAGSRLLSHEHVDAAAVTALFMTGAGGLLLGGGLWFFNRHGSQFLGRKEALLLVAISWIGGAAVAGAPYWVWTHVHATLDATHPFAAYTACYFEAMSGLTTTGATVLSDIELVPPSLLLWRAVTHWLGGLGIVVLFVAVLPGLGVGGKKLFQIESPGPAPEGLQPHIRETARSLWYIYLGMTVAETLALIVFGHMSLFDAICHTFATLSTGGFSTRNASVGAFYNQPAIDAIIIAFMVLAGANFGLYYKLLRGRVAETLGDVEMRLYLYLLLAGTLIIGTGLYLGGQTIVLTDGTHLDATLGESLRQAAFTTATVQTTTGFCTADFDLWPFFAKVILITLMFVGGCSGSTAGGIKVIRIWIMFKVLLAEIEHVFRPHVVRPVRIGQATIDPELRLATLAFVVGTGLLVVGGSVTITLIEQTNPASLCDFTTGATAAIATLFNIGPGLALVGATENYGWFSAASHMVMSLLMVLGRLEIYAIIVLLSPHFWRRT